jgi:hypothetical protein
VRNLGCIPMVLRHKRVVLSKSQAMTRKEAARHFLGRGLPTAAVSVGLKDYYETHYRMYCTYTHGTARAVMGDMDEIADPQDSRTMVMCAFAALDALAAIGARCPNATSLRARVTEMTKRKPEALVRHTTDSI